MEMQKRFSHLINRLNLLGNLISNAIATNKFLRYLTKNWKPKVTAIKKAKNLETLGLTALFGKLEEHEQELNFQDKYENNLEKKKKNKESHKEEVVKSKSLKASSSKSSKEEKSKNSDSSDDEISDDEEMGLFVRKYNWYVHKKIELNISTIIS